jgi:hypothetical protein
MLDKPENPVVTETPEEVLQIRLQHPAYRRGISISFRTAFIL